MKGFIYTAEGRHDRGERIPDRGRLGTFMAVCVTRALKNKVEVRITDCDDYLIFHAVGGEIIYPTKELSQGGV
ncbi:MAG: hypothetical protein ACR2P5_02310 [Gammaproteobacteria bacterium]